MGWASAGSLFDAVADGLILARASDEIKYDVLSKLARELQAEDWDTEYESLDRYKDDPTIVRVFNELGVCR